MKKSLIGICLAIGSLFLVSQLGTSEPSRVNAESETITKVSSYRLSSTYTNEQGPIWFYKYYDKAASEYGNLEFVTPMTNTIHWVGDQSIDAWKLPASTGKDGYVFAGQTWLAADGYNLSVQFVVPKTGKLDIDFIASRDFPSDWQSGHETYLRVIKNNGANLLSNDEWVTMVAGSYDDVKITADINALDVTEGDVVAVELDFGNKTEGWPRTYLDPVMTLSYEVSIPNRFQLSQDYTNAQGPIFNYKYFDKSDSTYKNLDFVTNYTNTIHWVGDKTIDAWKLPESTGKDGYIFAGQTWLPAEGYNLSLQFVAPKDGLLSLDFIASRDFPNDWDAAKAIYLRVTKNGGANLLSNDEWVTLMPGAYDDVKFVCDLNDIAVVENDVIAIELDYGTGATGWPRTYLDPVFRYLPAIKDEAKQSLASYKNASDYRTAEQATLAQAITNGNEAIDAATNTADVDEALAAAKAVIDGIKTNAQYEAEEAAAALAQAKTTAKSELEGYKNASDYRDAEAAQLATIVADGKTAIDAATTVEGVQQALAAAKAQADALKTKAQYEAEEAAVALEQAKTSAKSELEGYKATEGLYRDAEASSRAAIVAEGKAAIDAATTAEGVQQALAAAKGRIDALKTKAEYEAEEAAAALAQAKTTAKSELEGYKNASDYRDAEAAQLATIVADGKTAIDAATTVEGVQQALAAAKAQADALKTKAQYEAEEAQNQSSSENNGQSEETPSEEPAKKGCGGSIAATSALVSVLALAGFGLLLSKKRK